MDQKEVQVIHPSPIQSTNHIQASGTGSSRNVQAAQLPGQTQSGPSRHSESTASINVMTVYMFLLSGSSVTTVTAAGLYQIDTLVRLVRTHWLITLVVVSLLITVVTSWFHRLCYRQQRASKLLSWVGICVLVAPPLLTSSVQVVTHAAFYTAVLVALLSLKSILVSQRVVHLFLVPLSTLHSVVLVCSVYCIAFPSSTFLGPVSQLVSATSLHGGILVYSALLLCNTQRLCLNSRQKNFDPLFTAFVLYMNIVNLYSRIIVFSSPRAEVKKECL